MAEGPRGGRVGVEARRAVFLVGALCGTDTVANPPLYIRETRGPSCGRIDGVEAVWSHEDAIDAT